MTIDLDRRLLTGRTSYFDYRKQNNDKKPSFNGLGECVTSALMASDAFPMVGVSIIDVTSMIGPRTVIDATRNGFAATETFLRESSGLIINCLAPSFIVLGAAHLLSKYIMGEEFADLKAHKIWANQDSIETVKTAWLQHEKITDPLARKEATLKTILNDVQGLVGENWDNVPQKHLDTHVKNIAGAIHNTTAEAHVGLEPDKVKLAIKEANKELDKHVSALIEQFGASRNIKLREGSKLGSISCNFKELTRDIRDLTTSFAKIADTQVGPFTERLTKLVNRKSVLGLAAVMTLGSTVQWINRHITKKRSGCDGFVGDPNYGKNCHKKPKTAAEKSKFTLQKLVGVAAMIGLVALSFKGKRPNMKMFQFNGLFPTMDQCRLISAATFTGRIMASDDKNELRETTLRDMFGFANLYFLGDYVSKAYATFNKNSEHLLNKIPEQALPENPSLIDKIGHAITSTRLGRWIYKVELKGFDEIPASVGKEVKSARGMAQAAGLLYSCLALGLAVPLYNKWKTNKNVQEKQKAKAEQSSSNMAQNPLLASRPTMKGNDALSFDAVKIYSAFVNN